MGQAFKTKELFIGHCMSAEQAGRCTLNIKKNKHMKTILIFPLFLFIAIFSNSNKENIPFAFHTDEEIIPAPIIVYPYNNSYCDSVCTFKWTSSGKNLKYELLIADNISFYNSNVVIAKDTSVVYKFESKTVKVLYCKVRAWKSAKLFSNWSNTVTFTNNLSFELKNTDLIKSSGCKGNCGSCNHPCGKRKLK